MFNNIESVIKRIKDISPHLTLDKSTYNGAKRKCRFWEEGINEPFWICPINITNGNTRGHPKSSKNRKCILKIWI
jgi:hypothetical protein